MVLKGWCQFNVRLLACFIVVFDLGFYMTFLRAYPTFCNILIILQNNPQYA
jgi:hypothetical protein